MAGESPTRVVQVQDIAEREQRQQDAVLDGVEPGVPGGFASGGLPEGAADAVLRDDAPEAEGLGAYLVVSEAVDCLIAHQSGEHGDEEGPHDIRGIGRVGAFVTQGRAVKEAVEKARLAQVLREVDDSTEVGHPSFAGPASVEGGCSATQGVVGAWVLTSGGHSARMEGDGDFHGSPLF